MLRIELRNILDVCDGAIEIKRLCTSLRWDLWPLTVLDTFSCRFLHTCGGVSFAAFFPNYFEHSNRERRIRSALHPPLQPLSPRCKLSSRPNSSAESRCTMNDDLRTGICDFAGAIVNAILYIYIYSYSWDGICILKIDGCMYFNTMDIA